MFGGQVRLLRIKLRPIVLFSGFVRKTSTDMKQKEGINPKGKMRSGNKKNWPGDPPATGWLCGVKSVLTKLGSCDSSLQASQA